MKWKNKEMRGLCKRILTISLLVNSPACITHMSGNEDIYAVAIYRLNWGRKVPLSMSPRQLIDAPDVQKISADDQDFANALQQKLYTALTAPDSLWDHIDGRVVCLLHRNNSRVDTLTFAKSHMAYNSTYYKLDTNLLRLVGAKLPSLYQQAIERHIEAFRRNGSVLEK